MSKHRILAAVIGLLFSVSLFSQKDLKIVSWNLHLLPAPVFAKSKKKLRVDSIINHFTKVDTTINLLLFQEVFHKGRRKQLIEGLDELYPYYTPVVNHAKGKLFKTNSGLIIFSKTPFVQMKSIQFTDCSGSDCMAYKGAQFIHTVWNNKPILVVNTHLNSEPPRSIALDQTQMMIEKLIRPHYKSNVPIILGGDFNINCSDSSNYQKLLELVESKNEKHQDISVDSVPAQLENTLDYLFVYKDWLPEYFMLGHVYKYLIGPTWTDDNKKKLYGKTVGFSDHHPVLLKLIYTP